MSWKGVGLVDRNQTLTPVTDSVTRRDIVTVHSQLKSRFNPRDVEILVGLAHRCIVELLGFVQDDKVADARIIFTWEENWNIPEFFLTAKACDIPKRILMVRVKAHARNKCTDADPSSHSSDTPNL